MNIISARMAIIGFSEDGLEAKSQLICDETVGPYLTKLDNCEYQPGLEDPGDINLALVLGTVDPGNGFQALYDSALSTLSRDTLNIAVVNTMIKMDGSRQFNQDKFHEGINTLIDAYFVLRMAPKLFNADGGRARVNVLSNTVRIMLETMTRTDDVKIGFDDFRITLTEAGRFWLSTGISSGKGRAIKAARSALIDSFSDNRLVGAQRILLRVVGGDDLLLSEVHDVLDIVESTVTTDTDVIFGVARNHASRPSIKVILMATHFSTKLFPMFTRDTVV